MSDSDNDNYVYYGTALEEEVESRAGQHSKAVQDPSLTKSLPVWKQEVTDAEGRRRFHGAFTGGYSAGFYNTVGSQEGWQPKTFKSSRDKRSGDRQQNVEDFMDEDELELRQKSSVETKAAYDTFGDTATELARKAAAADAHARPSLIPGPVFQDLIAPVPDSVGIRLLQKMGWRQGKGVGTADVSAADKSTKGSRWGRVAGVGVDNTPLYALKPKEGLHGLGFDPFKNAEVFRKAKGALEPQSKQAVTGAKRTHGVAFGSGAADEDDSYGMMEDYVVEETDKRRGLLFEVAEGSDEEDMPLVMGRRVQKAEPYRLTGAAAPLAIQSREHGRQPGSFITGFVKGANAAPFAVFPPPKVPASYQPVHKFAGPLLTGAFARNHQQTGPAIPAPADATILRNINTLARYVSKNGPAFEEIARTRNATDPSFAFLRGGEGAAYYTWKVQQLSASPNQVQSASAVARRSVPLTADDRGTALGETALPSSASQHPLGPILQPPPEPVQYSGFVPSGSQSARPNLTGIAEGDRSRLKNLLASNFQQPSVQAENNQKSSLQAGLQHRAPTPAAAVAAAQGVSAASAQAMVAAMANRFASSGAPQLLGIPQGGLEQATAKPPPTATPPLDRPAPTRSIEEWRPAPLLCKRFNVMDPYKGKADRTVHMSRFKTDYLALPDTMAAIGQQPSVSQGALTSHSDAVQQQHPEQLQQQLPPPPRQHSQQLKAGQPQQQLPGPPRRFQEKSAVAATVVEQPQDGAAMADAFLSSLGMEMAAATSNQEEAGPQGQKQQVQTEQGTESDAGASTEQQQAALEKPIDLFKAIFENDDESSEDEPESGADAAPTPTRQQSTIAPTSLLADRLQDNSDPQDHQGHTNGQLPCSQVNMQMLQQVPSNSEVGSQIQQQLQPAAPVLSNGMTVHQTAAEQLVSRIRQSEDLGRHRSSKKKRKHREDDEEQPRKKKHKKQKDQKHSGRHKVNKKSKSTKLSSASAEHMLSSTGSESA